MVERLLVGGASHHGVVVRLVYRHSAEIVESAHVEPRYDGIELAELVVAVGLAHAELAVVHLRQVVVSLQGARYAARGALVGVDDETVGRRPRELVEAHILTIVVEVLALCRARHLVGGELLQVPTVVAEIPFPMGERAGEHGVGVLRLRVESVGRDRRIELLVKVARGDGERSCRRYDDVS